MQDELRARDSDVLFTHDYRKVILGTMKERHGSVPKGAFIAMRTDWSRRWPDGAALANKETSKVDDGSGFPARVIAAVP